jgi:hypothetical protein
MGGLKQIIDLFKVGNSQGSGLFAIGLFAVSPLFLGFLAIGPFCIREKKVTLIASAVAITITRVTNLLVFGFRNEGLNIQIEDRINPPINRITVSIKLPIVKVSMLFSWFLRRIGFYFKADRSSAEHS